MHQFTGLEYIKIDIANNFGKDKLSWEDRILWFEMHREELPFMVEDADNKFLAIKGLHALHDAEAGIPTGFIMGLDATASGLQVMACLSGCMKTAEAVNLVDTGVRQDVYTVVAEGMNARLPKPEHVVRSGIKKDVMTRYYNKSRPEGLTEAQEAAFHAVLNDAFTGAEEVMELLNSCWDDTALYHEWTLPDGHVAHVLVEEQKTIRVEIDELDHVQVNYVFNNNQPSKRSTSLCPNVIHSIDAYIAREMVKKCKAKGFDIVHIHDSFWASPNHMNEVRDTYKEILASIADSDLLQNIVREITGNNKLTIIKDSDDLSKHIMKSKYALS